MQDTSHVDKNNELTVPIVPKRKITGMSATLLPYLPEGGVDWDSFDSHIDRTMQAGLTPAVNMDTGYVNLLDEKTREEVLRHTKNVAGGKSFVAGVFVADKIGDQWNPDAYKKQIELIGEYGGTPVALRAPSVPTALTSGDESTLKEPVFCLDNG